MKYLILGKNGLLGSELVKVFADCDFIALSHKELDIKDGGALYEIVNHIRPNVIINATGYTKVDLAEIEKKAAEDINGFAVGILAKIAREFDATLVHFSTDYVFDGVKKNGYNEEDAVNPINFYGKSKALGEKLIEEEMQMLNDKNPIEGKYFIIRTSWLFGDGGINFVDKILSKAFEWNASMSNGKLSKALQVVDDQFGKPTFARDLAYQVKWLVDSREYPSGIYHITNEGETNWYKFATEIIKVANITADMLPCKTKDFLRPAERPKHAILNNNKLPGMRNYKEALKDYIFRNAA